MSAPFVKPVALSTPFDNSTNGFDALNVQEAIEEAQFNGVSTPRFSIVTTHNGTIGNNQWLGYDNLLPGDQVPIRIPVASILREITLAFAGTSVTGKFQLYKNGLTVSDIVYTLQLTNATSFVLGSSVNITLSAGDYIVGRWVDEGTNPSDMSVVYFPQATIP